MPCFAIGLAGCTHLVSCSFLRMVHCYKWWLVYSNSATKCFLVLLVDYFQTLLPSHASNILFPLLLTQHSSDISINQPKWFWHEYWSAVLRCVHECRLYSMAVMYLVNMLYVDDFMRSSMCLLRVQRTRLVLKLAVIAGEATILCAKA